VLWLGSSDCGGSRLVPAGRSDADPGRVRRQHAGAGTRTWQAV